MQSRSCVYIKKSLFGSVQLKKSVRVLWVTHFKLYTRTNFLEQTLLSEDFKINVNSWYYHSLNLTDTSLLCVISVQIAKKHKSFECHGLTRWFRLIAIFTNSKVWAAMRFSSSLSLAPSTIAGRLSSRHEQWTWKFWTNLRHFVVAKSQRDYVLELERTTDILSTIFLSILL